MHAPTRIYGHKQTKASELINMTSYNSVDHILLFSCPKLDEICMYFSSFDILFKFACKMFSNRNLKRVPEVSYPII